MTAIKLNFPKQPNQEKLSRLEFLEMFTDEELIIIYTAAKESVAVEIMMDKVKAAEYISLTDPKTIQGVQMLEALSLIAEGRAAQILRSDQ